MSGSLDNLIRTVFGEARGEDPRGQQAVASVILNRARQTGQSYDDVVMAPGQFEPWGDPTSRAQMLALTPDNPAYQAIAANIAPALSGQDPTGGADHFYSPTAQAGLGRDAPSWDNGKGTDIGRHRFFSLGYGGSSPMASSSLPSGADIFGFGGDETPQGGAPAAPASGADIFGLGDASAPASGASPGLSGATAAPSTPLTIGEPVQPSAPPPGTHLPATYWGGEIDRTGDGTVVNADTGGALNPAQTKTIQDRFKAGKFDKNAQAGSELLPFAQTQPGVVPQPGNWYVDLDGKFLKARNEARDAGASDPWTATASQLLGLDSFNPEKSMHPERRDPRAEALTSGMGSGLLMGGKNEVAAFLQSIPGFLSGGMPRAQADFDANLKSGDAKDKALAEAFPVMMNSGRVAGAVAGGVALPGIEGPGMLRQAGNLALQSGLGGVGGFLSTDGSTEDRLKGGAIGAIAAPVLALGLPAVLGPTMRMLHPMTTDVGASGMAANDALTKLGSSYHDLSPAGQAMVRAAIARGENPADAALIAMAHDLPVKVPMSRGDVTGLPGDQLDLNLALRGAKGPQAAAAAQEFQAARQGALHSNLDAIGSRVSGGQAPTPWGGGGAVVSDALGGMKTVLKAGVDTAYDAARAAPPAYVHPYDGEALVMGMAQQLTKFNPRHVENVASEIRRIIGSVTTDGFDVRKLYDAREILTNLKISNNPVEAKAAGDVVRSFDDFMAKSISEDLFTGSPEAAAKWKAAIGARRQYGAIFQADDLVERLTETTGYGSSRRLKVDPGDASNLIFGRSAMGAVGRKNLYTDLTKIRDLLGVDSEAWNGLRGELFSRMAQSGEGGVEGGVQQFSGVKFLKSWNDFKAKDMRLAQTMFTPEEIRTINQFAATSARITNPVKGGDNSSNTAVAMRALKMMGGLLGRVGKAVPLVGDTVFKQLDDFIGEQVTKRAMQAKPRLAVPHPTTLLPGYVGGPIGGRLATPASETSAR